MSQIKRILRSLLALSAVVALGACSKQPPAPPATRLIQGDGKYPYGEHGSVVMVDLARGVFEARFKQDHGEGWGAPDGWRFGQGWFVYAEAATFDRVWAFDGERCSIFEHRPPHTLVHWTLSTWHKSVPAEVWTRLPEGLRATKGTEPVARVAAVKEK